jgi:drug/metabolite transporter (DMT)-like permease
MRPVFLTLLSALLFGAATPAGKVLLRGIDPVQLAGWLYLGAAVGVLPAVLRGGGFTPVRRVGPASLRRLAGAIVCGGILGPIALLSGLRLASASSVSLWLNLELVATAVLGHFFFREQLGRRGWVGSAGVVTASVILSAGEGSGGAGAILLVALACLFWGLDNHFTALIDGITPAQSTFWKGLVAGLFNLSLAALTGAQLPHAGDAVAALVVGTLSYGASIALFIGAAQQLGATRAQMLFASSPFFGAAVSTVALDEPFGAPHAAAAALLVLSLLLLFRKHGHRHTHAALEHEHWHRHDDGHHAHPHPGLATSRGHSHRHGHAPLTHSHPHWHDLHHRHLHDDGGDEPDDQADS